MPCRHPSSITIPPLIGRAGFPKTLYQNKNLENSEMKNRIKVYRALRNLTQEALADQLGVTRQTILAIEKEKYDPSMELAFRISRLFKVPIEKMFFFEIGSEDQPLFEE
jgi:putative transcriptional regulator